MKYGQNNVYEVLVFNEKDELVAKLDSLKESTLFPTDSGYSLVTKDALLNLDFLKFIGTPSNVSDFEKHLGKKGTVIGIKKSFGVPCKIIAKTYLRDSETAKETELKIEIPNAYATTNPTFFGGVDKPSAFDVVFNIFATDIGRDGDYFKLHI